MSLNLLLQGQRNIQVVSTGVVEVQTITYTGLEQTLTSCTVRVMEAQKEAGFQAGLRAYQDWMRENKDRGYNRTYKTKLRKWVEEQQCNGYRLKFCSF